MSEIQTIPVSCNKDCGAGCALTAHRKDGQIIKITDSSRKPPRMRGCVKGYRAMETAYHPDRLKTPLIRTGERGSGRFREASWDEALDLIAGKLEKLRSEGRCGEVMRIGGSGSCRGLLHNSAYVTMRFLSLYGAYTETEGNYSSEASDYVKKTVFGTRFVGVDAATLLHSDFIILWGFNPSDTRFDSEVENVLKEASAKGTTIVVIDPRETRTVRDFKARWIPVLPGSDSAFMLAILWYLIDERLVERDFIGRYSYGFEKFEDYILGKEDGIAKTPEWAASVCGVPADQIRSFAKEYASASRAALLPGLSLQRALGGENADRLGAVLQLATANAGLPGGSTGAAKWNKLPGPNIPHLPTLERSGGSVPVYHWADAVLQGKGGGFDSDISFLYNVGGNYIGQGSDTAKAIKAFEKASFSVTHDYFLTDTACYSDVVLPVTTFLEREDVISTANNYLFYSARAIEPQGQAKNDFAIFSLLAGKLGFGEAYGEGKSEEQWIEDFLEQSEITNIADFKATGIYAGSDRERIGLEDFFRDPEAGRLNTPSGKIEIASETMFKEGGTLLPEHILIETTEAHPLRLITPHEKYRIHSQNDNIPSLKKLSDDRLWINEADAAAREIGDGDEVRVTSPDGELVVTARVTGKICRGALSLNQGVWALTSPYGANANRVTSTEATMPSRGSRTHSVTVEVSKI